MRSRRRSRPHRETPPSGSTGQPGARRRSASKPIARWPSAASSSSTKEPASEPRSSAASSLRPPVPSSSARARRSRWSATTRSSIDPTDDRSFDRLAAAVCSSENRLAGVIDCWSAAPPAQHRPRRGSAHVVAQPPAPGPRAHHAANRASVACAARWRAARPSRAAATSSIPPAPSASVPQESCRRSSRVCAWPTSTSTTTTTWRAS